MVLDLMGVTFIVIIVVILVGISINAIFDYYQSKVNDQIRLLQRKLEDKDEMIKSCMDRIESLNERKTELMNRIEELNKRNSVLKEELGGKYE